MPFVVEGKSEAPEPPNLRDATSKTKCCVTCHMYDDGDCWGYGNFDVRPDQVCDSYAPETQSANAEDQMTVTTADDAPRVKLSNTIASRKARLPKRGKTERRTLAIEELELRDGPAITVRDADGNDVEKKLLRFSGYASVFDRSYKVGGIEETIASGAFKRSLGNPNLDVVLRTEHGNLPLARTTGHEKLSDGTEIPTLRLSEDDTGLRVEALLDPDDPDVQRLVPKYRRGDLKEMSFAFRCQDDCWSDDYTKREIRVAEIHRGDVSIVTYGASPTTDSTLRSEGAIAELRKIGEEALIGSLQDFALGWTANYLSTKGERATLNELQKRAGKVISSASMETLRNVLDLVSSADDAVDEAQELLADLMGIPNPDDEDGDGEAASTGAERSESEEDARKAEHEDFWATVRELAQSRGFALREDGNSFIVETRETHGDMAEALSQAVRDKFKGKYDSWETGVRDFDDDNVHVQLGRDGLHAVPYSIDDDGVTLGDPTPVRTKTTYVPRAADEPDGDTSPKTGEERKPSTEAEEEQPESHKPEVRSIDELEAEIALVTRSRR